MKIPNLAHSKSWKSNQE